MRALSIRQPYAEMILRGVKTVEYRSKPTRIIGERFWIYAAKGKGPEVRIEGSGEGRKPVWSRDLVVPGHTPADAPPTWMLELAELLILDKLPRGMIVGSAVIERCVPQQLTPDPCSLTPDSRPSIYEWHLGDVERFRTLRKPKGHPQPVWFRPF
jgi:hypothetical protein